MNPDRAKNHYEILRPCMWFAVGDKVDFDKFQEYFTTKAVKSLVEYGYIKIIIN
jgi:hypothetical protein